MTTTQDATPRLLLLVPTSTYRAEAFVRAAQNLPVRLSIASEKPSALTHLHPVDLPAFDFSSPANTVAFIEAFAPNHPISAVVAVDDHATIAAAVIGEALGLRHNSLDSVHATLNKYEMHERLRAGGVPSPAYRLLALKPGVESLHNAAGEISYPAVLKPLVMSGSRGVVRVDNSQEFVPAAQRLRELVLRQEVGGDDQSRAHILAEQYVPGWEVAVEGIVTDGKLHTFAVFDKPDPLEGPYFPETIYVTPSRHSAQTRERIARVSADAVRAIGLRHGPIHAELRGDDDHVWFIEIAARPIGGMCSSVLRFEGELSLEDVILRHALGLLSGMPQRESAAAGVMMLQAPYHGIFREVRGVQRALDVDGIDDVRVTAHPGQALEPLPEGSRYWGFLFARARTPARVEDALRRAFERLEVIIDPTD